MKLIILILAVAVVAKSAPLKTSTDNCIANYLKKNELLTSAFGDESEVEITASCEMLVQTIKINIYKSLEDSLIEDEEMKEHSECIIDNVYETDYGDKLLVLHVLEKDNLTLKEDEKMEMKNVILQDAYALITKALLKCKMNSIFGEIFDSMFNEEENSSEEELSDIEDYCVRKYIIDNNLLDKSKYQLNKNPKNIDTTSVDCVTIFNSVVEQIEREIVKIYTKEINSSSEESKEDEDKTGSDCVLKVVRLGKYVEMLAPFDYLIEFNLSDEEKAKEKIKFINIMDDLTEQFALKCYTLTKK
ncbi:hypothetical protein PVAND_004991 [Polypedilum vanderplanki]|uniref:Uncharacterized protein n=1 Tax=Polypedilum vanderplanki TaxID=319348 RepID=A0A9J6BZP9_POLVA|nr:hypothetical protein PVAND_004991 [Polypedilum vanderplanki]